MTTFDPINNWETFVSYDQGKESQSNVIDNMKNLLENIDSRNENNSTAYTQEGTEKDLHLHSNSMNPEQFNVDKEIIDTNTSNFQHYINSLGIQIECFSPITGEAFLSKDIHYNPTEENLNLPEKKTTKGKRGRKPKQISEKKEEDKEKKEKIIKQKQKRVPYTTKGSFASGQKKNVGGILRDRIMKILKESIKYNDESFTISHKDEESYQFLYEFLKSMEPSDSKLLCTFLKNYDSNLKDHKKIKNKKNLKALKDMCESYPGGKVFGNLIHIYLIRGRSDLNNWIVTYKGKNETKEFIKSDELLPEVTKYMKEIWGI